MPTYIHVQPSMLYPNLLHFSVCYFPNNPIKYCSGAKMVFIWFFRISKHFIKVYIYLINKIRIVYTYTATAIYSDEIQCCSGRQFAFAPVHFPSAIAIAGIN